MKLQTEIKVPPGLMSKAPIAPVLHAVVMAELRAGMERIIEGAKSANPKTGDAFSAVEIDNGAVFGVGLSTSWPRWWALEYDQPPHIIEASNAPMLVFEGRDGHLVRTRSVNHPGHTGNMAVHHAVEATMPLIAAAVAAAGMRVAVTWGAL